MACDAMSRIKAGDITKNALNAEGPSNYSRFSGGSTRINQPFISGYWYAMIRPPSRIFENLAQDSTTWFFTTAESFSPHSRTLLKADVPGMGGINSSFVSGQDISRTFTVAFREYQNLPILSAIELWTSVMDQHLGTSPLAGTEFVPASYKGSAAIFLCRPTISGDKGCGQISIDDVEQMYFYDGVFPESVPHDAFSSDITGNDTVQLSVTFSFDGSPVTKTTSPEACITILTKANALIGSNNNTYSKMNTDMVDISKPEAAWKAGIREKDTDKP